MPSDEDSTVYVCVCNALNERAVREAIEAGARRVSCVYRLSGCRPVCGQCAREVHRKLREAEIHAPEVSPEELVPAPA